MSYIEILLLSVSLAMDCFAVSCATGVSQPKLTLRNVLFFAFCFGFFQAFMPLIGWLCGEVVVGYLSHFTNWIACFILAFIGSNMVIEGIKNKEDDNKNDMRKLGTVILLSIATSIDALAVGFGFSMTRNVNIWWAIFNIGIASFILSLVGYFLSRKLSAKVKANIAEIVGGCILILIGLKILLGL